MLSGTADIPEAVRSTAHGSNGHYAFGIGVGEKARSQCIPNPTTDVVRIELDKDFGTYDITVSDMGGRVVLRQSVDRPGVPAR